MIPINETFNDGKHRINVWTPRDLNNIHFENKLVLSIIDGGFPPALEEQEVRWLIATLHKAIGEDIADIRSKADGFQLMIEGTMTAPCDYCGFMVRYKDLREHLKVCPRAPRGEG